MATVSVIIVNWNGKHLLAECLDSLQAQTRPADEIFVVDNGSSDGSQVLIREQYPEVILIELGVNNGFSSANNVALERARGDYIALLNNDLLIDPEWMEHMVVALDTNPSLGSCACKMILYDRRDTIDAAGINGLKSGIGANRGIYQKDGDAFRCPQLVFGACAGAALYRTAMLHDIGFFDEDLYIYYEDVDLSFRAQLAGYNCLYVPEAVVYHHHGASSSALGKKYYYLARNSILVFVKNMPMPRLLRYVPHVVALQIEFALIMGRSGHIGTYARACMDAIRLLPRMIAKRRSIQQRARRSAKQVAARLT